MAGTALVVGASGIVGSATAALLHERGWGVLGLARRPIDQAGVTPVVVDLQDAEATAAALAGRAVDAVFITTWLRQDSEAENIRVNSAMVRNLLDGLRASAIWPRHVALVTGLKHYLGPFEAYGKGQLPATPFDVTSPVTTSGVSAANVVATIDAPASHHETWRPEMKYSSRLSPPFFTKATPMPAERRK